MSHDPERPSIDHSILSPSGRVSKRARKAAMAREQARLFPPGFWDQPAPTAEDKRQALLRYAKFLRELAERGMQPRKHLKLALQLEEEAKKT